METLHDVKRKLKEAKEAYNEERKNLDVQARDKALAAMLQQQRIIERKLFIREIVDFDMPDNAVALIPVDNYFRDKWRMEDKEFAGTPLHQCERSTVQERHTEALHALQRCHNAFYDAVDKAYAQTVAKERALGVQSSPPREVKKRYVIPPVPPKKTTAESKANGIQYINGKPYPYSPPGFFFSMAMLTLLFFISLFVYQTFIA